MDYSLPGSSVHGILQAGILEWVVMPSSRRSSQPRDQTCLFHLLHWQVCPSPLAPPGKPRYLGCTCKRVHEYLCVEYFVLWRRYLMDIWNQKMYDSCDPMDYSLPGSSVHGISQPRILEWVTISFSKSSSLTQGFEPGSSALQAGSLPSEPPGKPKGREISPIKWRQQYLPNKFTVKTEIGV